MIFHCTTTCSDCSSSQFLGCMPKTISYLDFPWNVQFFSNFMQLEYGFLPFLENLWTFLKKSFTKIGQSMKTWTLLTSHINALFEPNQPLFSLSLPIPPSRTALGLWRALHTTNGICTLHLSNTCFGDFPQCFGHFVPSSPTVRYRRVKPMSFLKFRSNQLGRSSFTSEADGFFILTVSLHETQLQNLKKEKKNVKIPPQFSLQTGASHCGKTLY